MSGVIMVVAPVEFRDEEYVVPRGILEAAGHQITVASTETGPIVGRFGTHAKSDIALCDAVADRYDCVVFVGGAGSKIFFDEPCAHSLAHAVHDRGGIVAAICIAPTILARAGMLEHIHATAFASAVPDVRNGGAITIAESVVVDGRFITADGPESAEEFGRCIVEMLNGTDLEERETA